MQPPYSYLMLQNYPGLARSIRGYQSKEQFLQHALPRPELGHDGLWFYKTTPKGMRLLGYWPPREYDAGRTENPPLAV